MRSVVVSLVAALFAAGCGKPELENCADGFDNDEDGASDCNDAECVGTAACEVEPADESDCDDNQDDDDDGDVDCEDSDCATDAACEESDPEDCNDGKDNDGDGDEDCDDSDCADDVSCLPDEDCNDGKDNDGDGDKDCDDSECTTDVACIEDCDDLIDNDGDSAIDCTDPECSTDSACLASGEICNDGDDNDSDGDIDCQDSTCVNGPSCDEVLGFFEIGHATIASTSWTGTGSSSWNSYDLTATSYLGTPNEIYCGVTYTETGTVHSGAASCSGCDFAFQVTFSNTSAQSGTDCAAFDLGAFDPEGQSYGYGYAPAYDYNGTPFPMLMYYASSDWVAASADVTRSGNQFNYSLTLSQGVYYY